MLQINRDMTINSPTNAERNLVSKNVSEITKLAKQLASKEQENTSNESSTELLDALASVAQLLEQRAGGNSQVKDLAIQVQELVKVKASK